MALTIFFIFHMIVEDNGKHHLRHRKFIKGDWIKIGFAIFWYFDEKNLPFNYC